MFHLFKKESICVQAPISGTVIALEQVNDPTFAQKLMGGGLAIKPADHSVCAPIEGELILVADTLHAFGIRAKDGTELLIHIGIDTVMLKGSGFQQLHQQGETIKAQEPIITFSETYLHQKDLDLTTIVIATNAGSKVLGNMREGTIHTGDLLFSLN